MSTHKDNLLQDLTKCTVAIENPDNNKVLGTGVIVTDDGLIVTCYHVLENIISNTKTVSIHFPTAISTKMQADIVQESYNQSLDIAFLKLNTKQSDTMIAANIGEMIHPTRRFIGFGFKKAQEFDGLHVNGEIQGKAHKISRDGGTTSPPLIQLQSHQIAPGMSGSAILDTKINKVIGIVSERYRTQDDVYKDLSFGIPVESIIKVYPNLREENPGLIRIKQFMDKIGFSDLYYRFDDLYVPPIEYEKIERTLETTHCLFITGTKEYGKTYTALKLLWEYYKKDYEPKYISETKEEVAKIVKQLADRDDRLRKHIIYIEDPVGKTEYIPNEDFRRHIVSALKNARRQDVYLIVTMREEIYNEFNPIGKIDPEIYVEKLNIAEHSYDYERRKEMLVRWAEVMNCRWLQNDKLRYTVFKAVLDESILPTPLNIKEFVMETDETFYTNSEQELLDIILARSRDTVESFADEIKVMKGYRILFLSFPFISEGFSVGFVEAKYQKLARELKNEGILNEYGIDFKNVLDSFRNNKINIVYDQIRFSHPSYFEAFQHAISEKGVTTKIGEILSTVLLKIADDKNAAADVAHAVAYNFDKLQENVRNLLFKFAEDQGMAFDSRLPGVLESNFDKFPENVRNELLVKLAEFGNSEALGGNIGYIVSSNFDKFPENVRNELLVKLADKEFTASFVAYLVIDNYAIISADVKAKLFNTDNQFAAYKVANAVARNFDKLPENMRNELLVKLADKKYVALRVAYAIAFDFDKLPENMRNELLLMLDVNELLVSLDDNTAWHLASHISRNFDTVPENMRNELLLKLADNKAAAEYVHVAVHDKLDKLPENIRNDLLMKLAYKGYASRDIAYAVSNNFDKLPENMRNELLLKLADNKDAANSVAYTVASNFDSLPKNIQNLLFKLVDNEETAGDVARAVAYAVSNNSDKLPESVRNELQKRLAKHGYNIG